MHRMHERRYDPLLAIREIDGVQGPRRKLEHSNGRLKTDNGLCVLEPVDHDCARDTEINTSKLQAVPDRADVAGIWMNGVLRPVFRLASVVAERTNELELDSKRCWHKQIEFGLRSRVGDRARLVVDLRPVMPHDWQQLVHEVRLSERTDPGLIRPVFGTTDGTHRVQLQSSGTQVVEQDGKRCDSIAK